MALVANNSHILQYGEYYGYESIDHYLKPGDSCPKGFLLTTIFPHGSNNQECQKLPATIS